VDAPAWRATSRIPIDFDFMMKQFTGNDTTSAVNLRD
jgi:hypothetical protein